MASDAEEDDRRQVTFQDSVFGDDDSDDVDGHVDAAFTALRFCERSVDKKPNSCPVRCENEGSLDQSPLVCDSESRIHVNHVAVVDSSLCSVDQKFGFDSLVNGTHGGFYETDCPSDIHSKVFIVDDDLSSSQSEVDQEFLSFSALFEEPRESTGSSSLESSGDPTLSENDLTDFRCSFQGISDVQPHSGVCSNHVVVRGCSTVREHGTNGISDELTSDLPKGRCAVTFNDSFSRMIDTNGAGSSVMGRISHSVVDLCCEPCLEGAVGGIKRDGNCDGFEPEGNECDVKETYDCYANSFPRPGVPLDGRSSRSSMGEHWTSEEERRTDAVDEKSKFGESLVCDEVMPEGHVDDESPSEDEEQKHQDSQHSSCFENEECSSNGEPRCQGSQDEDRWKCSPDVLEACDIEGECSKDEEEERNYQPPGLELSFGEVESSDMEELSYQGNVQETENICEDVTDSVCFEDLHNSRGVTLHEIAPVQRCSLEGRQRAMETLRNTDDEHLESSHGESGKKQCLEEGEERADRTGLQREAELKGFREEKKGEFQAVETGISEVRESDDNGALSIPKEMNVQDEIEEEMRIDDEVSEEIQSSDESKEEMLSCDERETKSDNDIREENQNGEDGKEEMQSDEEKEEEIKNDNEVKEEMQGGDDWKEEIKSDEDGKEEIKSEDEVKEEMQSGDNWKEEIRSDEERNKEIKSDNFVKEEMQSYDENKVEMLKSYDSKEEMLNSDESKEEMQGWDESNEEMHNYDKSNEEMLNNDESKEEIKSDDESKEEIKSDDESKEEIKKDDESEEEIKSDEESKEEIRNDDEIKEEMPNCDGNVKEQMQSCDERKEQMQSDEIGKEEKQSCDEGKEKMQTDNGRDEMPEDTIKTKRPTFLLSPCNNNFHPSFHSFMLSSTEGKENEEENQLQHETKETEVQHDDNKGYDPEDMAIEKKPFGDGIKNGLTAEEKIGLLKYSNDKNKTGLINLPYGLCTSEKKNQDFVLNFGCSNAGSGNSRNYRIEADIPGTKKPGQSSRWQTTSRFCPINLDYISSNDTSVKVDGPFSNESSAENCNSLDLLKNHRKESRVKDSISDAEMRKSQIKNLSLSVSMPRGPSNQRTEFNDIPEKFLVPSVCVVVQNNIMTPQEDLGFAKVPGFVPRLDSMEEESEVVADGTPDELLLTAAHEIDELAVDREATSLPKTCDLESDPAGEKHDEATGVSRSGARPKELPSSLHLPIPPVSLLSPKLQLSPKPQLKSARPNSLVGLSKPDVNLPSMKVAAPNPDTVIHEDSFGPIHDISSLTRKKFSFPTCGKLLSSTQTETSILPSPLTLNTAGTTTDKHYTFSAFPSSNEVLPSAETRAQSKPLTQRPTSWSQPPLKTKSVLPKRPNSLNITVSNVAPVRTQTTTLGLQVPLGTPCLAGSMVVAQSSTGVLPPSKEPLAALPREVDDDKSYGTGLSDSASHDSPASVSAISPPISSNINLRITELGKVAPIWVPDADAPRCMQCESRFTFTRRRHHCRTCGKVFCSGCCNVKVKLGYLDQKEGRVCSRCYQDLLCAQLYENLNASSSSLVINNHVPAAEPTRWTTSAGSVSSSTRGFVSSIVVKKEKYVEPKPVSVLDSCYHGNSRFQETDGGKAGTDAAAAAAQEKLSTGNSKDSSFKSLSAKATAVVPQVTVTQETRHVTQMTTRGPRTPIWPDCNGMNLNVAVMTESSVPSKFTLLPNLKVSVSIVNLDCCMGRVCWCFVTSGLCAVGQDEVIIVLERLPSEERIPSDVFYHICDLYHEAAKGNPVGCLGHTLARDGQVLLESVDHAGFLYLRPTFQCLQKLPLPPAPYLFGVLVHRTEVPWLQVFPVRLMLRLGAQYRYYPCPLVSMRFREPVYREIGHTIMNLLVDLRNFQYRLPRVDGLVVHMEDKKTFINLPRSRYRDIKRAFNNNNDHIVALEVSFSCVADSHLVCFQNLEGKYITQAINIQNRPRKSASFVVFNGALRPISGMHAKCSMVEDGLMVQVSPESMHQLKQSISSAEDYSIGCGRLSGQDPEEWVILKWVDDDNDSKTRPSFNRIRSPIDGMVLDRARSRRISSATDYVSESLAIRWTEIFYMENPAESRQENDEEFEEVVAQACCMALCRHLEDLRLPALTRIGLRVTLGSEQPNCNPNVMDHYYKGLSDLCLPLAVKLNYHHIQLRLVQFGYKIGANGSRLPDVCLSDLDSKLIPVLENPQGRYKGVSSILELLFYLLEQQHQPQHLSPEP